MRPASNIEKVSCTVHERNNSKPHGGKNVVACARLTVPEAAAPAANYVPFVSQGLSIFAEGLGVVLSGSGNLLFISGQIPKTAENVLLKGAAEFRTCSMSSLFGLGRSAGFELQP